MKVDIQNIIIECEHCGCQLDSELSGLGGENGYGVKISVKTSDCACSNEQEGQP